MPRDRKAMFPGRVESSVLAGTQRHQMAGVGHVGLAPVYSGAPEQAMSTGWGPANQGATESKKETEANRLSTYMYARRQDVNFVWIITLSPQHQEQGAAAICIQSNLRKIQ